MQFMLKSCKVLNDVLVELDTSILTRLLMAVVHIVDF